MEKKKNTVNLTDKKQIKEHRPKNQEIKKQVNDEASNKKIVIAALVLALVLGIIAYWQVSKKNDNKELKNNKNVNTVEKNDTDEKDNTDKIIDNKEENSFIDDKTSSVDNIDENEIVLLTSNKSTNENEDKKSESEDQVNEKEDEQVFYSLNFNTNGGNKIEKQVLSSTDLTESILPKKNGWSFAGWYKDSELTEEFIFGRALTEDTELYAKWIKYVEFKTMDDELIKTIEVGEGEVITLLTKEDLNNEELNDYEIGWSLKSTTDEGKDEYTIIDDKSVMNESLSDGDTVSLYLKKLEKFDVFIYLSEDDDEAFDTIQAIEEKTLDYTQLEDKLIKENISEYALYYLNDDSVKYSFFKDQKASKDIVKLYLDEAYIVKFADKNNEEANLTNNEVSITDDNNNNVSDSDDDLIIIEEVKVALNSHIDEKNIPKLEKRNYELIGWFLKEDLDTDNKLTENTIINGNKIYIAKWKKKEETLNSTSSDTLINDAEVLDEIVEPVDKNNESSSNLENKIDQ